MPRRQMHFESCEPRIALSATNIVSSLAAFPRGASVVRASDNTTNTARDLGLLEGSRTISNGYVGRFDERDVFRFELARDGEVAIQLDQLSSDADVYLLNTNRETVASSSNSGTRIDSVQESLGSGEYFVVVQNYHAWSGTNYRLQFSATLDPVAAVPVPSDRAGDSIASAYDIGSLRETRSFNGQVGGQDQADVLRFRIDQATRLTIELSELEDDVDLYLLSQSGSRLLESKASGTSTERLDAWVAPGEYHLAIVPYRAASSSYRLTLGTKLSSQPVQPSDPAPTDPAPDLTPPEPNDSAPETSAPGTPTTPPSNQQPSTPAQPTPSTPIAPAEPSTPSGPLADVPFFGSSSRDWGLNAVNAPEAWAAGYSGAGVTVAVIDTGVQIGHADLQQSIWINSGEIAGDGIDNDRNGYIDDVHGWDFVDRDSSPQDGNGHGTHVAGTIAAARNGVGATGVAYASSIMPVRVLDNNGSGNTNDVARAIRYAVDNGADIINLSLGGGNSQSVFSALQYAEQNDVFVVAASGNESSATPGYPARHSASLSNVISVGAHSSSSRRASFSNRVGGSGSVQIDGPGQSVYSTYIGGRYATLSGTSMAAPHVAGVAALTLAANPNLTSTALRDALTQGVGSAISGSDSLGRLDAAATIPIALGASPAGIAAANSTSQGSRSQLRVYATLLSPEDLGIVASASDDDESKVQFQSESYEIDFDLISGSNIGAPASPQLSVPLDDDVLQEVSASQAIAATQVDTAALDQVFSGLDIST